MGHQPLCNGRAERAPVCGGFVFPLCWRCVAIATGALLVHASSLSIGTLGAIAIVPISLVTLPCIIDGYLSNRTRIGSTNARRVLTGLPAGIGLGLLASLL